jgi:chromosomal replication initiation ATPase DnaA
MCVYVCIIMFIRIDTITLIVSKVTEIPVASILSKARNQELCYARGFIVNIGRRYGHTFKALGKALNRDHSTCVKSYDNLLWLIDRNAEIKHQLNQCYTEIKQLESIAHFNIKELSLIVQET